MYIANSDIYMSNLDTDEKYHKKYGNLTTKMERKMLRMNLNYKVTNLEIRE